MILKTIGRLGGEGGTTQIGTTPAGRKAALESLVKWGVPADGLVMYDGSGLSRYNYVTADGVVTLLKKVWSDEKLRGPFVAALPVGGHDGTLSNRMKDSELDRRVQAKTGSISNVRSLSGFLETNSGERLVFSMIANHFTAPASQIDGVVEKALTRAFEIPAIAGRFPGSRASSGFRGRSGFRRYPPVALVRNQPRERTKNPDEPRNRN
jgi:D-alanyl-D-alanine carboxypeptidase